MNTEKFHVFFRRVSTAGQDLAMQESADAIYREKLLPDEIKIIEENAISANKKKIHERPGMQSLISLIKQNKVDTLYAFDRTRLFRDFYEGMQFIDLCSKANVKIILTSQGNGNIQATDDFILEGFLSMFSGIEGKNIARRTEESRKRYPPKKLGYVKVKELKKYWKEPLKKETIEEYFDSLLEITTIEELGELLKDFQKKLGCNFERLINLARDPFYAAYDLSHGENKLHHVEPYIDLETYYQIQKSICDLLDSYLERTEKLENQNTYTPICGMCLKAMSYRIDKDNYIGNYTCSNKHAKLMIASVELEKIIQLVLHEVITKVDSKKLLDHSITRFREIKNEIEADVKSIEYQEQELTERIILNMNGYSKDWREDPQYNKMIQLKNEKVKLREELSEKEVLLQENREIVDAVKKYLHNRSEVNPSLLYKMFIHKVHVYQNEVDIDVSLVDYIEQIQTEFIFSGDGIA